jgi:hypothetical protein
VHRRVNDPERARRRHFGDADAGPADGLGDRNDPLACRFDQGCNGGDKRHGNGNEK